MQLTARPSPEPLEVTVESQEQVEEERPRDQAEGGLADGGESAPPSGRAKQDENFSFILLNEGKPKVMSGSSSNLERARQHLRGSEPLLWLRYDGREYVVREPQLLRRVRELWTPVQESVPERERIDALVQSFKTDELAEISSLAAEQGMLGARLGALAAEQAMHALVERQSGPAKLDELEIERHAMELEESAQRMDEKMQELAKRLESDLEVPMRELDRRIDRDVENQMRDLEKRLEQDLERPMRDLEHRLREMEIPMREMTAPMEEFGRQMEVLGRAIEDSTREAIEEMRALIDRAIASGLAEVVR
jgi:hypothetical protein